MSTSSPADLAIAFRSIQRRSREAQGDAPDEVVATSTAQLAEALAAAAALLGSSADPAAIATAIESVNNDEWTADLARGVQDAATAAGAALRSIAAASGADQ